MLTNYSKYWTTDDDDASRGEGWVLGANDAYGKVQLTRTRKDAKFDSDNAAVLHVVTEAAKGSRRHLLALILLGTGTRPHTAPPVPDLLLDTSIDIIDTETDEDKGLLVTHNGISVYWAEKDDDCLSTCMVAMSPHIWDGSEEDVFDIDELDEFGDSPRVEDHYHTMHPGDHPAQLVAFNIDLGHITKAGYEQASMVPDERQIYQVTGDEPIHPSMAPLLADNEGPRRLAKEDPNAGKD